MRNISIVAAIMIALPGIAAAQVGPNPAVSGGSLDPTMGPRNDMATAPHGAPVGLDAVGTGAAGTTGSTVTTTKLGTRNATDATIPAGQGSTATPQTRSGTTTTTRP